MDPGFESYRRFLQGEEDGLAEIIRMYKDGLILYLNSYVKDLWTAEELTEEVFVKLVVKRPHFSWRYTFKTWLYTIGKNAALNYLRRGKHREVSLEEHPLFDSGEDLEQAYLREESRVLLHRGLEKLKPEQRQVLWLAYFEAFSYKEIARILGKTVHNVETIAYRARRALKTILIEEGFDYEKL